MTTRDAVPAPYIVPEFAADGRPDLRAVVIWLDGLLADERFEALSGMGRETMISVREEVLALANGGPLTEYGFLCTCSALDYFHWNRVVPSMEHLACITALEPPEAP